jgi:hypothetical protein
MSENKDITLNFTRVIVYPEAKVLRAAPLAVRVAAVEVRRDRGYRTYPRRRGGADRRGHPEIHLAAKDSIPGRGDAVVRHRIVSP